MQALQTKLELASEPVAQKVGSVEIKVHIEELLK